MAKPFEVGKTYKDNAGRSVRIIATDRQDKYSGRSVTGLVTDEKINHDHEYVDFYASSGESSYNDQSRNLIEETARTRARAIDAVKVVWEG